MTQRIALAPTDRQKLWRGHGPQILCRRPHPSCLNGVDNDVDLSAVGPCLKQHGYSFVGRYLGGPCYQFTALSLREAQALSAAGLWLVSIYVGANAVRRFSCGIQSVEQGRHDGQEAAALAQQVSQPRHTAIYLNLEPQQVTPLETWLTYVDTWIQTVADSGYVPGVYSSTSQLKRIHELVGVNAAVLYWVTGGRIKAPHTPPPCPQEFLSFAHLWQYVHQVSVCDIPGMDIDSAANPLGMWSLS